MQLQGIGVPFNSEAVIGNAFREVFMPGAFKKSLRANNQFLLFSHDMANVLAARKNGTLTLTETDQGLRFKGTLAETTLATDVHQLVRGGFLGGASVGFIILADSWTDDGGPLLLRQIHEAELHELSIVAAPAYKATSVDIVRAKRAKPGLNARLAGYARRAAEVETN